MKKLSPGLSRRISKHITLKPWGLYINEEQSFNKNDFLNCGESIISNSKLPPW